MNGDAATDFPLLPPAALPINAGCDDSWSRSSSLVSPLRQGTSQNHEDATMEPSSPLAGLCMSLAHGPRHVSGRFVGAAAVTSRFHKLPRRIEHDYVLQSNVLGTGYNGAVRMAVGKENPEQKYAVKTFDLRKLDKVKKDSLVTEVDIHLGMDHPHVGRLFDVYQTKYHLRLVLECLEGGELFDRVTERKRFSEGDAAQTLRQMLLAISYIHSHGVVHRDIKLENFLFDGKGSDHLKLIDFGFSKVWDRNTKMQASCGTMAYVAPEVLQHSYTSQCDMWSVGVIAFILLAGYMPFSGSETNQARNILQGEFKVKPQKWETVSPEGFAFVKALLQVDPKVRLTACKALDHPWIEQRHKLVVKEVDASILDSFRQFAQVTKFRRCCMEMMAWSLSNQDRAKVRQHFLALDKSHSGTITLRDLKTVMVEKFHFADADALKVVEAMDTNNDETIHYSDFLAAMVSTRIELHEDLLRTTFNRLDADGSGSITVENLRDILGDHYEGEQIENLIKDADFKHDGQISYDEFTAYVKGIEFEEHASPPEKIIDAELQKIANERNKSDSPPLPHCINSLVKDTCSVLDERLSDPFDEEKRPSPTCWCFGS
eukprot:TRINITY_DN5376_c0_g2_i1.p1 TRINITY_DN5376_c0_g2~~TRINITY_DN5376_c0_g2_i1.p1  ORF type:complete len:601 (+),score=94.43 TRINITY_DN5376_c0_g2_i1:61-1863(+)